MPVDRELQHGQGVQIGAVLRDLRDLLAQGHQREAGRRDEGSAAVEDGSAGLVAAAERLQHAWGVERHVGHVRDPVVLADDACRDSACLLDCLAPSQVAAGTAGPAQADGERGDAEAREQRLVAVLHLEIGADADDGRELRGVENVDAVVHDLPEGLALGPQGGADGDRLVALHRDAGPRPEDVLRNGPVLGVALAVVVLVGWRGVHTVRTP
mmetsp:Transcript_38602/g.100592  ORF Transcript_38602/g.100592 Transcript_38602/m.100592 type:complete len:212 (+) Transcript_38602:490-1125(+)